MALTPGTLKGNEAFDESVLVARAKAGDAAAFTELVNHYERKIYRLAKHITQNDEDAEDVLQETFLKAWKALESFSLEKGGSFQAFLFRIARNLIIDLSRKHKEIPIEIFEETLEIDQDVEGQVDRKDNQKMVRKALEKLNDLDKQIVMLFYFEEMSGSEIAKVLNMKEGAMRVRLHRSLKKLKEEITHGR